MNELQLLFIRLRRPGGYSMTAPNGATETDPEGGFPLYILDDDTLVVVVSDMSHCDFWESTVAATVAEKHELPLSAILNLPYCQRRARIVGNRLYCGEEVSPALLRSIEAATGRTLKLIYDEHETRCPVSVAEFTSLVKQPPRGVTAVTAAASANSLEGEGGSHGN